MMKLLVVPSLSVDSWFRRPTTISRYGGPALLKGKVYLKPKFRQSITVNLSNNSRLIPREIYETKPQKFHGKNTEKIPREFHGKSTKKIYENSTGKSGKNTKGFPREIHEKNVQEFHGKNTKKIPREFHEKRRFIPRKKHAKARTKHREKSTGNPRKIQ